MNSIQNIYETAHRGFCARVIPFIAIIALTLWFRLWHFGDLLILKSDQARDAVIIHSAVVHGFQTLPLLGPQIGGTELRLGPLFYYLQFLSASLFGNTFESYAYPDLLAGIATIPLLALLFHTFFKRTITLWLTSLASVSVFLITFSRFGWNPNSLPFFTTLFLLCFFWIRNATGKKRWFLVFLGAISLGYIAQLHLMAILYIGLAILIFTLRHRTYFSWQELCLSICILLVTQAPVILAEIQSKGHYSDLVTHGIETKLLPENTETSKASHTIPEKIFRATQEISANYLLTLTGYENNERILTKKWLIKCDASCKASLPFTIASLMLLFLLIMIHIRVLKNEQDPVRKERYEFVLCNMLAFFLMAVPLAYELETRFFLSLIPVIFLHFGIVVEYLLTKYPSSHFRLLFFVIGAFLFLLQFFHSARFILELSASQYSAQESHRDLRFGSAPKVTLGQLRSIARDASTKLSSDMPVIMSGESLYTKALYAVMSTEFGFQGCYVKGKYNNPDVDLWQHLVINYTDEHTSSEHESSQTPYGTLSAESIPLSPEMQAHMPQQNSTIYTKNPAMLPDSCLDY